MLILSHVLTYAGGYLFRSPNFFMSPYQPFVWARARGQSFIAASKLVQPPRQMKLNLLIQKKQVALRNLLLSQTAVKLFSRYLLFLNYSIYFYFGHPLTVELVVGRYLLLKTSIILIFPIPRPFFETG